MQAAQPGWAEVLRTVRLGPGASAVSRHCGARCRLVRRVLGGHAVRPVWLGGPSLMKVQRPRCSHAAHWSIQSTADVLEHAGGRPQWFLRSASGDSAESRYAQALAGAWFCAGESGCRDGGCNHPLVPASWYMRRVHCRSPGQLAAGLIGTSRGRIRLAPHSSGGWAGLASATLGICETRCHFAGAQSDR